MISNVLVEELEPVTGHGSEAGPEIADGAQRTHLILLGRTITRFHGRTELFDRLTRIIAEHHPPAP